MFRYNLSLVLLTCGLVGVGLAVESDQKMPRGFSLVGGKLTLPQHAQLSEVTSVQSMGNSVLIAGRNFVSFFDPTPPKGENEYKELLRLDSLDSSLQLRLVPFDAKASTDDTKADRRKAFIVTGSVDGKASDVLTSVYCFELPEGTLRRLTLPHPVLEEIEKCTGRFTAWQTRKSVGTKGRNLSWVTALNIDSPDFRGFMVGLHALTPRPHIPPSALTPEKSTQSLVGSRE